MSAKKNVRPMFTFEARPAQVLITSLLPLCIITGRLCSFMLMFVLRIQALT